jgi:hypothetical protein
MNSADLRSAQALIDGCHESLRGSRSEGGLLPIHLDRDAISLRGWLSRKGRRLLERPGHLLSERDGWWKQNGGRPGLAGAGC